MQSMLSLRVVLALLVGIGVAVAAAAAGEREARTHELTPEASELDANDIAPGDTVLMEPGVYSAMPPIVSGEPGRPVVYRAAQPGTVILDGTGEGKRAELAPEQWDAQVTLDEGRAPWAGWPRRVLDITAEELDELAGNMIRFDGVRHVKIQGLVVRNTRTGVYFLDNCHDITLEDIEIYQTRLAMRVGDLTGFAFRRLHLHHNHKGIFFDDGNANDGLLEHVIAEYNDDGYGRAGDGDGFQMRAGVNNITFRHCIARRNGEDGFDLKGWNITAEHCIAAQNGGVGIKTWNRGLVLRNIAAWGNTQGVTIGNFYPFRDNDHEYIRDVSVVNSTIAANRWVATRIGANMEIELRNNIFDASAGGVAVATWQWRNQRVQGEHYRAPRIVAANHATPENERAGLVGVNLIWANHRNEFMIYQDRIIRPASLRDGEWDVMGPNVRFIAEAPAFVNVDAGDLRLRAQSPAIDAGETRLAPAHDLDEVARPQGRAADLGAYEYVGE